MLSREPDAASTTGSALPAPGRVAAVATVPLARGAVKGGGQGSFSPSGLPADVGLAWVESPEARLALESGHQNYDRKYPQPIRNWGRKEKGRPAGSGRPRWGGAGAVRGHTV